MLSSPLRRMLIVLIPPLLFGLIGAWQLSRGVADVATYGGAVRDTKALAGRLEALAPDRRVAFAGMPQRYTRDAALALTREGLGVFRRDAQVADGREVLGAGTLLGAAASLGAGGLGLLLARRAARSGLVSRERLASGFERVRHMLPALLGTQVAGLALALLCAVLFEAAGLWFEAKVDSAALRVSAWGVVLAGAGVWLAIATLRQLGKVALVFAPAPLVLLGRTVDRDAAPGLWRFVEAIAARDGAPLPDHIVIGLIDGAFVTSSEIDLGPEGRTLEGRTLHLPAPCLALLDADETAAVVTHEFAHLAGDDLAYSRRFLPVYAGIGRTLAAVGESRASFTRWMQLPAFALGRQMIEAFEGTVRHWSRRRELAADAASATQPGGAEAAASALIRTRLIAAATEAALLKLIEGGATSSDMVAAIVAQFTDAPGDPAAHLTECQPHPTDSHPPVSRRIEALGRAPDAALLARAARRSAPTDAAFAASLFADWPGLCAALGADAAGAVAAQAEASEAVLEEAAARTLPTPVAIHEDRRGMWRAWVLLMIVAGFAVALGAGLTVPPRAAGSGWWIAAAAELGLIVAAAACVRSVIRRRAGQRMPFLIVDAEGLTCRGLAETLPWAAVDRITVLDLSTFTTVLFLTPDSVVRRQPRHWGVLINRRRHSISLIGPRPRRMTPQDYFALLQTALDAFRARQALAARRMTAPADADGSRLGHDFDTA